MRLLVVLHGRSRKVIPTIPSLEERDKKSISVRPKDILASRLLIGPCNNAPTMFWRAVFWIAIVEVLICVLPIELAGLTALVRLFLFGN